MKKVIILSFLLLLALSASSQNAFKYFFKPVPKAFAEAKDTRQATGTSVWFFRPAVTVTALRFTYVNEPANPFEVSNFSNMGAGLSYQHFIDNQGTPYNNFGFSVLALFNNYPLGSGTATMSMAGTVNLLQYWNLGAGWDFSQKKFFFLTGITYSFN